MPRILSICLINPRSKPSYWTGDYSVPLLALGTKIRYSTANGSLVSVAALVPSQHRVTIVDENVESLDIGSLADFDIVGVTGMIVQAERMVEILEELRKLPVIVAVGGPYVSVNDAIFAELSDARFVGEAETTWPEFVNAVAAGRAFESRYKQAERTDMTSVPTPRFDLLRSERYQMAPVQFSRGCPFQCEFCDIITIFGRKPRVKTADQIIAEIDLVREQGFGACFLVDDNFIGNKREAKKLLPRIIAWQMEHGYPLTFITEASVNLADDPELLDLMVKANFRSVFVGIETPRMDSLIETNKLQNTTGLSLIDRIRQIRAGGINVFGGFIVGFDSDDRNIFDEQFDFIQRSGISMLSISILTPLPTTPLYDRLEREGRLDPSDPELMFIPKQMSRDELKSGFKDLLARLWDVEAYFDRVFTTRRELPPPTRNTKLVLTPKGVLLAVALPTLWLVRALLLARYMYSIGQLGALSQTLRRVRAKNRDLGGSRLTYEEMIAAWIAWWHFYRVTRDIRGTDFGSISAS
jgi:radical SAM superfamily enzyme YgiQ (UPF0313 family)